MPLQAGKLLNYVALLQGVVANAALDGNPLSEDQVDRLLEGSLNLPPSQAFAEREIRNLIAATNWIEARIKAGDRDQGPWTVQMLHALAMKDLPTPSGSTPGAYRTSARANIDASLPPEEIEVAVQQLQPAASGPEARAGHAGEHLVPGILQALQAHLHLVRIAPFAEGNGRVARLLEYKLLRQAGVPIVMAHRLTVHAASTAREYGQHIARAMRSGPGDLAFVTYMVQGFAEEVKALLKEVTEARDQKLVPMILHEMVGPEQTPGAERLNLLAKELHALREEVSIAQVPKISPDLAFHYARLNAKTLQRDLLHLEKLGLVERSRGAVRAKLPALRPFGPTL